MLQNHQFSIGHRRRRDCNPWQIFSKKFPNNVGEKQKLYGPGHKEIQVLGRVETILDYGKISLKHDLYVVKNLEELLLGGPAIIALKISEKINTNNENHRHEKEFPRVF